MTTPLAHPTYVVCGTARKPFESQWALEQHEKNCPLCSTPSEDRCESCGLLFDHFWPEVPYLTVEGIWVCPECKEDIRQ